MDIDNLKAKIQELLGKEVVRFELKGTGACNNAYYVETRDGEKLIVKKEREVKEFQPQNDLLVEAAIAKRLGEITFSIPTPKVVFISDDPKMYGYGYIEGEIFRKAWLLLTEEERVDVCRQLGKFHAELGKMVSKEEAEGLGVKVDDSIGIHPENTNDNERLMADETVPHHFKELVQKAAHIFEGTTDAVVFQFLHNDAHHENVLVKDKKITGYIDFGESEYGEIAKEFSRYIRDFPNHFSYIVAGYEGESGNSLSRPRLISNALLSGFVDIVEDYRKSGEEQAKAEESIETYRKLLV